MVKIEEVLRLTKIMRKDLAAVEWENVPKEKLDEALSKMFSSATTPLDLVEETKEGVRKLWREANGNPYRKVNFSLPPFPNSMKQYKTFEGWFDYFYAECSGAKQQEFYKECLNPDGTVKGDFASANPTVRDAARKSILKRMLDAGFVAYGADFFGASDDLLKPILKNTPLTPLKVGFRGELRPPATVKMHDGCRSKAMVDAVRQTMGMNEPWHPFTDAAVRAKAYYRNGSVNQDNCLFTAVSVATNFETASKFPLMQDLIADSPDAIGTATVLAKGMVSRVKAMAAKLQGDIFKQKKVTPVGVYPTPTASVAAERRILRCVRMNVYLFTVPSGWDTEKKQIASGATNFPERATLSIPWGNFFARVRCDRIQYDDNDSNCGHLLIVSGYDFLQSRDGLLAAAGGNKFVVVQLKDFLNDIAQRGALKDGKGGIHVDPGKMYPTPPIEKVERVEPRCGWL